MRVSAVTDRATDPSVRALLDRQQATDVLYRYSVAVDSFDAVLLRSALADDIWAQYGNGEPVQGADRLVEWITGATATVVWQHHQLSPYEVTVEGDGARALSYLTSLQVFSEDPSIAVVLAARYHDELRRGAGGVWKLSRRVMEVLWGERRANDGFLDTIGGRGPKVWARD